MPAGVQPQDAECQRSVNRGLCLVLIHAQECENASPASQHPARVDRPEGLLEIHCIAEPANREIRKMPLERSPKVLLVGGACRSAGRRSAMIAPSANFHLRRPRLAQLLHQQAQVAVTDLRVHDSPHRIPFRRPQVQHALVVFPRDGAFRLQQIEHGVAIFKHGRVPRSAQKLFQHLAQGFRGHDQILRAECRAVCDP